jgi:hypothetical protein
MFVLPITTLLITRIRQQNNDIHTFILKLNANYFG